MSPEDAKLLIGLFLVHFLFDFPLQPVHWIADRYQRHARSTKLYWHSLAHGAGASAVFVLCSAPLSAALLAGSVVLVTHCLTDLGKSYLPQSNVKAFIADQLIHWLVLVGVWSGYTGFAELQLIAAPLISAQTLLVVLAYLLVLLPTSVLIAMCLRPWIDELRAVESDEDSLTKAGAMIGYLERLLILTFVLVGEYIAIGFVMALKTAFRFKDTEDRRKAEYMMMGTFLSFTLTIAVGLLAKAIMAEL